MCPLFDRTLFKCFINQEKRIEKVKGKKAYFRLEIEFIALCHQLKVNYINCVKKY